MRLLVLSFVLVLAGCPGDDDARSIDAGPTDGGTPADSGTSTDTGLLPDAGMPDVGIEDTGPVDTGPADTGPSDTGPSDTGPSDTGEPVDAGDSGTPDAGPPCPFDIDDTIEATLRVSVDDDRRVYVNELMVDDFMPSRTWNTVTTTTVNLFRHPARANVVAVHGENLQVIDGVDRGILLEVTPTSTTVEMLVTNGSWRVSSSTIAGFETIGFDDSGWSFAVEEVMHPGAPYGALFGTSDAWWIWHYDSDLPVSQKPVFETGLARRRFYILTNGQLSDTPGQCP